MREAVPVARGAETSAERLQPRLVDDQQPANVDVKVVSVRQVNRPRRAKHKQYKESWSTGCWVLVMSFTIRLCTMTRSLCRYVPGDEGAIHQVYLHAKR